MPLMHEEHFHSNPLAGLSVRVEWALRVLFRQKRARHDPLVNSCGSFCVRRISFFASWI